MVTTAMAVGPSSVSHDPLVRRSARAGRRPRRVASVVAGERVLPALAPGAVRTPAGGPGRLRDVARGEPWGSSARSQPARTGCSGESSRVGR